MNELDKAYGEGHAQGLQDGTQMMKGQIDFTIRKLGFTLDDLIGLADLVSKGIVNIFISQGVKNDPEHYTKIEIRRA
jgi:hypothetical protein